LTGEAINDFPVFSFFGSLRFDHLDVSRHHILLWLSAFSREVSGFVAVVARASLLAVIGLSLAVVVGRGVAARLAFHVVNMHPLIILRSIDSWHTDLAVSVWAISALAMALSVVGSSSLLPRDVFWFVGAGLDL
jgi:hypothetical protein